MILDKYLNLLIQNNIKPIILVCPESEFSRKYIDNKMEIRFLKIIELLNQKYDFVLLNYFNDIRFEEEDFYDGVHLNYDGSKKFTEILNNDINVLI
ncbi:lysophospholipase L1-like esterase [Clostridium beijerinckii]|nr:lysophospholipase L1-like esterase [Clostridium beijerinckii]